MPAVSKTPSVLRHFLQSWTWRMAWRDSRTSRRRLLLFSSSIMLGIAALVAIGSFGRNSQLAIEEQAKTLLGADLVIGSRQPFGEAEEAFLKSLGGEQAREINFSSMLFFSKSGGSRLVQVRALSGGFPFYGLLESQPAAAAKAFRSSGGVLVEAGLLTQFDAFAGDLVRLGEATLPVAGSLLKVPGETVAFATIAPRVYIGMDDLPKTRLIQTGSLVRYKVYFRFPPETNVELLVSRAKPQIDHYRFDYGTVEKRKEDLGRSMTNLYHYLNLVGFIALLLGGVGIASAIHVHIKQKLGTVAVLRCLGCSVRQTFAIYLAQGMALGMAGSVAGALLGLVVQVVLPRIVADFLPFPVSFIISWRDTFQAMGLGFVICLLFSLLPLLTVRLVSPLAAIRASFEPPGKTDPLRWVVYLLIAIGVVAFAVAQSQRWYHGVGFAIALGCAFALLGGVAKLIAFVVRRGVPASLPYVWRQGLANLHRPNNRTVLLMLSLGLGTFLILTLYLTQRVLLTQLFPSEQNNQPNSILFDIQPDQRDGVAALLRAHRFAVMQEASIVTMRLSSIKGRAVETILKERTQPIPGWVLRREYRSTYRDHLVDSEELSAGRWQGEVKDGTGVIPVSVEEGIAKDLNVTVGDDLVFDVQGVSLSTRIASLRKVDWRRIQPNFFVVFPKGVLEDAPAFHVFATRIATGDQSARFQRDLLSHYPNVSTVDLTLVLQTIDSILGKISFVIRFMALFTVATGLLVLAGAVLSGRYQRIQESILLRTLGASRAQIQKILLVEYLALGSLAGLTGALLAVAGSWALAAFVFKVSYTLAVAPLVLTWLGVVGLTVGTGLLANRGVCRHSPLEILRSEVG